MPITQPMPNSQNDRPTPTMPAGPGFVATNTQPVIRPIITPSKPMLVGAIGQVAGRFIAPYAADAARPAAASSATMNVTQPIGANALDVSRAASGPISRHFLI